MIFTIGLAFGLGIFVQILQASEAADQQASRWHSVELLSTNILSARLLYLSPASLADEKILVLEFDNRSGTTLDISESRLNLDATYKDPSTGRALLRNVVSSSFFYEGTLAPGITTATGDILNCSRADLLMRQGLPSNRECRIDITARCDVHLRNGGVFATLAKGTNFHMDWHYPSPSEIANAQKQLRKLLEVTAFKSGRDADGYIDTLNWVVTIPEVADALTVDELLRALSYRRDSIDGRNIVSYLISLRFPSDPKVISYYSEHLSEGNVFALSDIEGNLQLWNPSWIPPLVANFEKTGNDDALRVLGYHRADWITNEQDVSRLSASLLRHYPILAQDTSSLTPDKLNQWKEVANQAGIVGDKALVRVLAPALNDKRIIPNPLLQALTPPENRVCDWALLAILTILDGSQGASLKQAATNTWERNPQTRYSIFDAEIVSTKERIK